MSKLARFKDKVKEWERELAYGSETPFWGDFLQKYHNQEYGKNGILDDDFIECWTDAYNYLFEIRDAIKLGIVTPEEVDELWDIDYKSSKSRIQQLIASRNHLENSNRH